MELVISGRRGMCRCSWVSYALLRERVSHYAEGDQPRGLFRAIHGISRVTDESPLTLDAVRLRLEMLRAWSALRKASSRSMGVGALPRRAGVALPGGARRLLRALLWLTNDVTAGETVCVRRLSRDRVDFAPRNTETLHAPEVPRAALPTFGRRVAKVRPIRADRARAGRRATPPAGQGAGS